MGGCLYQKISDGNATIGDVSEFLQRMINEGKLWMLSEPHRQMAFLLSVKGICDLSADIEPKDARYRAENPQQENSDDEEELVPTFGSYSQPIKFGGKISPPRSIRRVFGVK